MHQTLLIGLIAIALVAAPTVGLSAPGEGTDPTLDGLLPPLAAGIPVAVPILSDFQDISATGTALPACDDCLFTVPIGFDFPWYGAPVNQVRISTNGVIGMGTTTITNSACCTGQDLSTTTLNNIIAVWWEDLDSRCSGSITYEVVGTAPQRAFIVQYTDVPHYWCFGSGSNFLVTAQAILHETTGLVELQYLDSPTDGGFHTIGIKAGAGVYTQYYRGQGANPSENAGVLFVG